MCKQLCFLAALQLSLAAFCPLCTLCSLTLITLRSALNTVTKNCWPSDGSVWLHAVQCDRIRHHGMCSCVSAVHQLPMRCCCTVCERNTAVLAGWSALAAAALARSHYMPCRSLQRSRQSISTARSASGALDTTAAGQQRREGWVMGQQRSRLEAASAQWGPRKRAEAAVTVECCRQAVEAALQRQQPCNNVNTKGSLNISPRPPLACIQPQLQPSVEVCGRVDCPAQQRLAQPAGGGEKGVGHLHKGGRIGREAQPHRCCVSTCS